MWVEGLLRHSALASERDALFGLIVLHPELLANNYLFQRCSVHALASVLKKLVSSAEPSLLPECFSDEMSEEQLKKEVTIAIQKVFFFFFCLFISVAHFLSSNLVCIACFCSCPK